MDDDIQFGEVEEAGRKSSVRPDLNRHYAVVAVHSPEDADLPIFVDIDVMRDMESHAMTDTSVELGGVLLGGQYEDEQGEPFVVVTDSLRAEHYEATKGSFKFTHETWQKISRQREEFPEELQMVGWYHTHPDWGVFLSGMDMFICDNFFNRPLDLALVIDPCRGDRGWFHWVPGSKEKIRRTGGFYLIGSRFRQAEIEYFAFQLKGKLGMAAEFRNTGVAGSFGPPAAPVVNITDSRNAGSNVGMLGILAMQFLFLAVIAWKLLLGGADADAVSELKQEFASIAEQGSRDQRIKILEKALTLSGDKSQLVSLLDDKSRLEIQLEDSTAKRTLLTDENKSLIARTKLVEAENATLMRTLDRRKEEIGLLKTRVRELEASEGEEQIPLWKNSTLVLFVAALGLICVIAGGSVGCLWGRSRQQDDLDDRDREAFTIPPAESQLSKENGPASESDDDVLPADRQHRPG